MLDLRLNNSRIPNRRPARQRPKRGSAVDDWRLYRTRFLAKAKRLEEACTITDISGRPQRGEAGDYLVEASDGSLRIAPAHVFEDIYVEFETAGIPLARAAPAHQRPPRV